MLSCWNLKIWTQFTFQNTSPTVVSCLEKQFFNIQICKLTRLSKTFLSLPIAWQAVNIKMNIAIVNWFILEFLYMAKEMKLTLGLTSDCIGFWLELNEKLTLLCSYTRNVDWLFSLSDGNLLLANPREREREIESEKVTKYRNPHRVADFSSSFYLTFISELGVAYFFFSELTSIHTHTYWLIHIVSHDKSSRVTKRVRFDNWNFYCLWLSIECVCVWWLICNLLSMPVK